MRPSGSIRNYSHRHGFWVSILLCVLMPVAILAQNIDSLRAIWRSGAGDADTKYRILQEISNAFAARYEADSALAYARLQLRQGKEMKSQAKEIQAWLALATLFYDGSQYEEALASLDSCLAPPLRDSSPDKLPDIYRMYGIVHEAQGNPSRSLEYFTLSHDASVKNGDSVGLSKALNSLGISHQYYLGNYQKAIDYYLRAIAINKALGRTAGLGNNYYNLSGSYYSLGNTVLAIEYQLEALKQFERTRDTVGIQDAYNTIGNTYSLQNDFEKAMEYFNKSLELSQHTHDRVSEALVRINIGNLKLAQGLFPEAGEQLGEGVRILEQIGNNNYLDHGYLNLGKYYLKTGNPQQAKIELEKAVRLAGEDQDDAALASALAGLGAVAYEAGNYRQSLAYLKEGIPHARKLDNKEALSDIYEHMYKVYAALGDLRNELDSYRNYIGYRDSLFDMQSIRATTRQEMEFQFSRKQLEDSLAFAHQQELNELAIRRGRSQRNFALIGMLVLVLSTGLIYRQYRFTRKARKRSDELLLNILPAEVAQELKTNGKAEARNYEMVSILFTDFQGFTQQASLLPANELLREINQCFEAFDRIMERYGIEKIKTIGDSYMAAGGLPVPSPQSCKNTIRAALEMQEFITQRALREQAGGRIPFSMRLGIHTGPVVAGIVGVKKFQYDLWGDTVNTASRLESYGEVGRVNISQTSYELVRDDPDFIFEPRGKIQVKGKGNLDMYYVRWKE